MLLSLVQLSLLSASTTTRASPGARHEPSGGNILQTNSKTPQNLIISIITSIITTKTIITKILKHQKDLIIAKTKNKFFFISAITIILWSNSLRVVYLFVYSFFEFDCVVVIHILTCWFEDNEAEVNLWQNVTTDMISEEDEEDDTTSIYLVVAGTYQAIFRPKQQQQQSHQATTRPFATTLSDKVVQQRRKDNVPLKTTKDTEYCLRTKKEWESYRQSEIL